MNFFIAPDSASAPIHRFNAEDIKDADNIQKRFHLDKRPKFLFKDGKVGEKYNIGDDLEPFATYVLLTKAQFWEDKEKIQNAAICSTAVYKQNPFQYLKGDVTNKVHTINEVVAFGNYTSDDGTYQKCLMAISENVDSLEKILYVSFRGTESNEDWLDNLDIKHVSNVGYQGTFHSGFYKRANLINLDDINKVVYLNKVEKIIFCGHSLGGAVASIVYLLMLNSRGNKKEIFNITFGAPYIGNSDLQTDVISKRLDDNMFHFVSVADIVPGVLDVQHTFDVFTDKTNYGQWIKEIHAFLNEGSQDSWKFGIVLGLGKEVLKRDDLLNLLTECNPYLNLGTKKERESLRNVLDQLQVASKSKDEQALYVPIGKTVILEDGSPPKLVTGGYVEIDNILKISVQKASDKCSLKSIFDGHKMEGYMKVMGIKRFDESRRIKIHKIPQAGCFLKKDNTHFHFLPLTAKICEAGDSCDMNKNFQSKLLYVQEGAEIGYCRDCRNDPLKEGYHYHHNEKCLYWCNKKSHVFIPLHNYEFKPNQISILLDDCYNDDKIPDYMNTKAITSLDWWVAAAEWSYKCPMAITAALEMVEAVGQANSAQNMALTLTAMEADLEKAWELSEAANNARNRALSKTLDFRGWPQFLQDFIKTLELQEEATVIVQKAEEADLAYNAALVAKEEAVELSKGAFWSGQRWNLGIAVVGFGSRWCLNRKLWTTGKISSKDYCKRTTIAFFDSAGGFLSSLALSQGALWLGCAMTGPIGIAISIMVGVGGAYAVKKVGDKLVNSDLGEKWFNWIDEKFFDSKGQDEERNRAKILADAMQFLETPSLNDLTPSKIESCFRKKSLEFHPDRNPENEMEAKILWQLLVEAKDTLSEFLDNKTYWSDSCQQKVDEIYRKLSFDKVLDRNKWIAQKTAKAKEKKAEEKNTTLPMLSLSYQQ